MIVNISPRPESVEELLAREELPGVVREMGQQVHGFRSESDLPATAPQAFGPGGEPEWSERQLPRHGGPPDGLTITDAAQPVQRDRALTNSLPENLPCTEGFAMWIPHFRDKSTHKNSHAVVVGGSMAGLLAARVLSDHFGSVTVLERDRYPAAVAPRAGVPQAHHVHALLLRGLGTMERLFPGIRDELARHGAAVLDSAQDFEWLTPGGWAPRFNSGLPFLSMSRPLLDCVVLGRVAALRNIRFREDVAVDGFSMDRGRSTVTGVALRGGEHVPADIVVDATGRASQSSQWLAAFGYTPPQDVVVNGHLGYASRIYRRAPGAQARWKATYSQAAPPRINRTGLAFPIEGERWIVTVAGGGGDYPPTDEQGFAEFASSLPNRSVYEVIRSSEPLTPIRGFRGTENRMRRWDKVRTPKGFVALGDSACAFNPVYGQGISTAAIGAELLDHCLCSGDLRPFQKKLTAAMGVAWMLATSEDVRYPGVEGGDNGLAARIMHWYLDRVIALSTRRIETRRDLLGIFHLVRAPQALFSPATLLRAVMPPRGGFQPEEYSSSAASVPRTRDKSRSAAA